MYDSMNSGRLHFLTWLKFSRLDLSQIHLSTYLSQKVKWFRWAKVKSKSEVAQCHQEDSSIPISDCTEKKNVFFDSQLSCT